MTGGGGRGGLGSKVIQAELVAAAGLEPFATDNNDQGHAILYTIQEGFQRLAERDSAGAGAFFVEAIKNYPSSVRGSVWTMVGDAIGAGVVGAAGRWGRF